MDAPSSRRLIVAGVVLAFVLLIAAVWASDASTATSLALSGLLVLIGVGALVTVLPTAMPWGRGRVDEQRERMKQTTP